MDTMEMLIMEIARLRQQVGGLVRHGTVHKVKGDKLRAILGKDKNGKDVIGPWLDTAGHRGGSRERKFYKEGQNISMLCPNGDISQAVILPYAPNKKFNTPDHSNEEGQDEESYQLENLRVRKTKNGYAIWLQDPPQEDQQQQGQDGQQSETSTNGSDSKEGTRPKRSPQKPKAEGPLLQITKDGGITGRIGKDVRFSVSKDGAKLKAGDNYSVVTKDKIVHKASGDIHIEAGGTPYVSKQWVIGGSAGSDPVSDDDKVLDQDEG